MNKIRIQKKQQTLKLRDQALALAVADSVAKHIANSTQPLKGYLVSQRYITTGKKLQAFHGCLTRSDFGRQA